MPPTYEGKRRTRDADVTDGGVGVRQSSAVRGARRDSDTPSRRNPNNPALKGFRVGPQGSLSRVKLNMMMGSLTPVPLPGNLS